MDLQKYLQKTYGNTQLVWKIPGPKNTLTKSVQMYATKTATLLILDYGENGFQDFAEVAV